MSRNVLDCLNLAKNDCLGISFLHILLGAHALLLTALAEIVH